MLHVNEHTNTTEHNSEVKGMNILNFARFISKLPNLAFHPQR